MAIPVGTDQLQPEALPINVHRELFERLRDRWIASGARVQPGATEDEISQWEARTGIVLPPEFREYFSVVNGMVDWDWDADLISFHSLSCIEKEQRDQGSWPELERGFPFADYSIHCWTYGICIGPESEERPVLVLYDEARNPVVAPSFPEFIRRYLENPTPVLFPDVA